jgi:hypothetical protein
MQRTQYLGHSTSGPSPRIWADCPWDRQDPALGFGFFDDFLGFQDPTTAKAYGPYLILDTGDSTLSGDAQAGGACKLLVTTDNEDCGIKLGDALSAPFKIPANSGSVGKLWFECRVKKNAITDNLGNFFVGLAEKDALAANFVADAANDFADKGLIGFWNMETDATAGDSSTIDLVCQKAGAGFDVIDDDVARLVADTYMKLGFVYDPNAPKNKRIKFFIDGVEWQGAYVGEDAGDATVYLGDTTNFPGDVLLAPILYLSAGGASDMIVHMDWWGAYQLRSS